MLKSELKGLSKVWRPEKKHRGVYNGGKAQLSTDGAHVACLYGGGVNFLALKTGDVARRLGAGDEGTDEEGQEEIVSFCLNPCQPGEVVTASRNLLLRHWRWVEEGEEEDEGHVRGFEMVRALKAHTLQVLCMDYDGTGTLVATGSADRTIKVWDFVRGYATHNFKGHSAIVTAIAFHPDPNRMLLVSGSEDCSVRLWDLVAKKSCVAVFSDHLSVVTSLSFSGGYTLLSGSRDKVVNFWDLRKNKLLHTLPVFEEVEGLQVVPEKVLGRGKVKSALAGGYFATAGTKGIVRLWKFEEKDTAGGSSTQVVCQTVKTQPSPVNAHLNGYTSLILDQRNCMLIAITGEHNFICLDCLTLHQSRQLIGYNDEIVDIAYIPGPPEPMEEKGEGPRASEKSNSIAVATNSAQVRIFNLTNFSYRGLEGHTDIVVAVNVSADGRYLVTASKDQTCRLWKLAPDAVEEASGEESTSAGKCVFVLRGHTAAVGAVALSQRVGPYDAGTAFLVSGSGDKTIKRWSLKELSNRNLSEISEPIEPKAVCSALAHDKDINDVSVSPNDAVVATASQDKTAKLWSSEKLALQGILKGHKRGVWKVVFSPVDRTVATSSGDRTVRLWSAVDCSCLKTLQGHTASVLCLAFVRSGMQILSGGADGLIKLWTIRTSECEGTFDEHTDRIWALAVHPSGEGQMVTGGSDSVLNVWRDVSEQEEQKEVSQREATILKEQELMNHMFSKDYTKAVDLALELDHPRRLWTIFKEVLDNAALQVGDEAEANGPLDPFVSDMDASKVAQCFVYIREWNTNSKYSPVAQSLLSSFFRLMPMQTLKSIPNAKEIVSGIIPYTERHFQRVDRMVQASYLVEYVLSSMRLLQQTKPMVDLSTDGTLGPESPMPVDHISLDQELIQIGMHSPTGDKVYEVVATNSEGSTSSDDSDMEQEATLATTSLDEAPSKRKTKKKDKVKQRRQEKMHEATNEASGSQRKRKKKGKEEELSSTDVPGKHKVKRKVKNKQKSDKSEGDDGFSNTKPINENTTTPKSAKKRNKKEKKRKKEK